MNRRQFLAVAGVSTGYSLFVKVDGLAAEPNVVPNPHDAITPGFDTIAPLQPGAARFAGEPHMTLVDLSCDVFVAGGGPAGVCAAVAAARNGAKVILAQDRSRLGGNSSSEVKMHIVGADVHGSRAGWRESGLIEEFRLDDAVNNPQRSWEMWDLLLYDKVKSAGVTLLLDSPLFAAQAQNGQIQQVMVRCDKTEHLYRIKSKLYLDCTGDCRLAIEAGAETRWGRETKAEFKESLGLDKPDRQTLGSSILFTSRNYGKPMPFRAPAWARQITKEQLKFRGVNSWEYGYWWIEWGGQLDTVRDNERIRFELLAIVLGVWDYIKNSGEHPTSATWALDWVGMIPGKRESRRIVGDHILTQSDLMGLNGDFEDAVAIGGWPMDDHPPSGIDATKAAPTVQVKTAEVYNIPLRSLYAQKVNNLMMAGRNISATHVAFTSSRVMATCAVMGQAAGTAAALCARYNLAPRKLYEDKSRLNELQQTLLRDDQTIKNRKNADKLDLARSAKVTASGEFETSKAANVVSGVARDAVKAWDNRWGAPLPKPAKPTAKDAKPEEKPEVWLDLAWDKPQKLSKLQFTFDTGFQRQLTLSASDGVNGTVIRAAQPETVRDYSVTYLPPGSDQRVELLKVEGNYQRLNRHQFAPVEAKSIRLHITATNGSDTARVYEVRAYA